MKREPEDFIPDHNLNQDESDLDQDLFDDYQQSKEDLAMED